MSCKNKKAEKLLTYREAAKMLGVTAAMVLYHIRKGRIKTSAQCVLKTGIPVSEVEYLIKHPPKSPFLDKSVRQDMIKEYKEGKGTMLKIANKYGVSEGYVSKLVKGTRQ